MATTTVIPTVAAELKTLLTTALASVTYEGVAPEVFDAYPAAIAGHDYVVIGDIVDGRHSYPVMKSSRKPREEAYTQRIEFVVTRAGGESTAARTQALLMFNELEDLLADDPQIGLTAIPTLRLEVIEFGLNTTHEAASMGWRVTLTADVLVQARLT